MNIHSSVFRASVLMTTLIMRYTIDLRDPHKFVYKP